jgi:hypothetical protein
MPSWAIWNTKINIMIKTWIEKVKALCIYAVGGSCECGVHSKCVRKIHSNSEGKLGVENEEHFKCGKVKKQVKSMLDWWNNYR